MVVLGSLKIQLSTLRSFILVAILSFMAGGCGGGKTYSTYNQALREAEDVEKLVLSRKRIGVLPADIARLANLKELRLFKCNLHKIPPEIGQLDLLEELVLSSNKLTEIPAEIGQLKNLKRLSIHHNNLKSIPPEIGNLDKLEILNLSFNNLDSLPQEIIQLKNLKYLYLSQNQLTKLPMGFHYLSKLEILDLERNNLREFPNDLGYLKNLLYLNVAYAGNGLTISEGFCNPSALEELVVGRNTITPACINSAVNNRLRIISK